MRQRRMASGSFAWTRRGRVSSGGARGQILGVKAGKHLDTSLKALVFFPVLYQACPDLA